MKKWIWLLAVCLLLTGCARWMDGAQYAIEPHQNQQKKPDQSILSVSGYSELVAAVGELVEQGAETGLLDVEDYDSNRLPSHMERVTNYIQNTHPIGAYAVTELRYELGVTGGVSAVALTIEYSRSVEEIQAIRYADDMNQAKTLLGEALEDCEPVLVMRVEQFREVDFAQLVEDFAQENPALVMEVPALTATFYPATGTHRVVDLRFSYQTNRDSLRTMQKYVSPIFASAALYVSSEEESEGLKYGRLYAFLMERNEYKLETSITPTYSLLRHGVGDSKAFAVVYSAMCRRAGLECRVVSGTHQGEARFWNIIRANGGYYHVDLLEPAGFVPKTDAQMTGYVWDYSAYPACAGGEVPPETTAAQAQSR